MGVADVFTALTEDRPYRKGMESAEAIHILNNMDENRELDSEIVHTNIRKFDTLDEMRALAQYNAANQYKEFQTGLQV